MKRILILLCMVLSIGSTYAQRNAHHGRSATSARKVLLDTFFNHEVDKHSDG